MKHKIELARRFFRLLYEVLFSVLLMFFIELYLFKENPVWTAVLLIPVLFLCSYIIREKAPNYLVLVIVHLGLGVIPLLLPFSTGAKVVLGVFVFYLLDTSFMYLLRNSVLKPMDDMPWPSFLTCIIICLFGNYAKSELLIHASYIIPILMLLVYFLAVYMEGLSGYMDSTKDVSGLPMSHIVSTNSMIVTTILVLFVVGLFLGRVLHLENIVLGIGRVLISFVRLIGSIVSLIATLLSGLIREDSGGSGASNVVKEEVYTHYSNAVGESFEVVLKLGIAVLVLYVVYKIAVRVIRRLMKTRNYANDTIEVAQSNNIPDVKKNPLGRLFSRLSREEKFRKYYRDKILRYRYDVKLDSYHTCRDIEREVEKNEVGDVGEITEIYSMVRYGGVEIDRSLLKKMGDLSKK